MTSNSTSKALPLVLVAAMAENGVIGDDNRLIWRLKTDLQRFRSLTLDRPVIMGRKTFQSIGRPLPRRENIILTRDASFQAEGVHVVTSLEQALALGQELGQKMQADSVTVAGGADIYAQTLALADRLALTLVHANPEGDAVFPAYDRLAFKEKRRESHPAGPDDEHPFTFIDLHRVDRAAAR